MKKQYRRLTRAISLITLLAFFSTQIAWGYEDCIRLQQPNNSEQGPVLAQALGGDFKVDAGANGLNIRASVSKASNFLYRGAPWFFAVTVLRQLVLGEGVPKEIRIAGAGLIIFGFAFGKIFHMVFKKGLAKRNRRAYIAALFYTITNTAMGFWYVIAPNNLLHDIRSTASQIIWRDRQYGRQNAQLIVESKEISPSGVSVQSAKIKIEGRIGRYEDSICLAGVDPLTFDISVSSAVLGEAILPERLVPVRSVIVMNGGYYSRDENGRCYPTGLEIIDGRIVYNYKNPGKMGSLEAILVITDKKVLIVPSDYYSKKRYPFDGRVPIRFALQAGPLPVYNSEYRELSQHFHGDGRSLSAVCLDNEGEVYFLSSEGGKLFKGRFLSLLNRFFKGLIGPDYENTARFAAQMLSSRGRRLISFMYLDGGGSSFLKVEDGSFLIKRGPGYHPVVSVVVSRPRMEVAPVSYILDLIRTGTQDGARRAVDAIESLGRPGVKSAEDFQKILGSVRNASPEGLKAIFTAITREQSRELLKHHPETARLLAELVPYKALGVLGINRRLTSRVLAENINRVVGLPIRELTTKELLLGLRRYDPEGRLVFLRALSVDALQWLGGLEHLYGLWPEGFAQAFESDLTASTGIISGLTNHSPARFIIFLGQRQDVLGFDLIDIFNNARPEEFGQITAQILLADTNKSKTILESYMQRAGIDAVMGFIRSGLRDEANRQKIITNLRKLQAQSPDLEIPIRDVLNEFSAASQPNAASVSEPVVKAQAVGVEKPWPVDVKVETVGEPEVVLRPDPRFEKYILNPGGMPINGWRILFPRRAIEGIVSQEKPDLLKSIIGCYIDDLSAIGSVIIDRDMLKPDDHDLMPIEEQESANKIVALEDARAVEYDGTIFLILNIIKEDGSHYLAVTTHSTQEFINIVQSKIDSPDLMVRWKWARLERLVKDGPYAKHNVKSALLIGAPSPDGTFSILYRPTSVNGNKGPEDSEIDPRRFIRRLVSKDLKLWSDAGVVYYEEKREGCWVGPSAYVSGPPDTIDIEGLKLSLEFILFHTGAGDSETGFKYYHLGLIVADRYNIDNYIVIDPIIYPEMPNGERSDVWVDNVRYSDCAFFVDTGRINQQTQAFEILMDVYYAENDGLIKKVTKKIIITPKAEDAALALAAGAGMVTFSPEPSNPRDRDIASFL